MHAHTHTLSHSHTHTIDSDFTFDKIEKNVKKPSSSSLLSLFLKTTFFNMLYLLRFFIYRTFRFVSSPFYTNLNVPRWLFHLRKKDNFETVSQVNEQFCNPKINKASSDAYAFFVIIRKLFFRRNSFQVFL